MPELIDKGPLNGVVFFSSVLIFIPHSGFYRVEGDMPHMTIVRGGPGSGKTFQVAQLCFTQGEIPTVCSADEFFIDDDGHYSFDPKWLGRAHGACLKKCVEAMVARKNVIIDNTNSSPDEMLPYLALCQAFGYTCTVIKVLCDRSIAWKRQTHGVPEDKFNEIHSAVEQTRVPKLYRGAPWLTEKEVRSDGLYRPHPKIYQPYSGARCVKCSGNIVYSYSDGSESGFRYCDHEEDRCTCPDGQEKPGEPFPGLPRECNCGVSKGLRSDHESQCVAAYIQRNR
jgi:hypothetical protein